MRSLDSIQTTNRRTPEKKQGSRAKLPDDYPARRRKMWVAVALTMGVIILAWVSITNLAPSGTSANPFDIIANQFSKIFSTQNPPSENANTQQGDSEELQELRGRVFPQFENVNVNTTTNAAENP